MRWRRDGRELLYLGPDGRMMAVDLTSPVSQPAHALFTFPPELVRTSPIPLLMDMTPDASKFLVALPPTEPPRTDLEVVLGW